MSENVIQPGIEPGSLDYQCLINTATEPAMLPTKWIFDVAYRGKVQGDSSTHVLQLVSPSNYPRSIGNVRSNHTTVYCYVANLGSLDSLEL